ncbi:SDR family NAD(P)-dependent oxidoreductase [Hyphococcus luteus]|uniref:3-oxoacyl-ACP reductase n=1 Tax=Hyphococcus luteus TaxID=2058213 RepID=A0A2S7K6X4_9PROT|nr:SDR family oxidoreductase [Marinicaulis flavus]PQA88229.1 3-oxoacyl-ACP reductase [Marinicaulis flavus]
MGRLEGKTAIVTGSGRGIGKAIALAFAKEGAKVAVVSLTPEKIEETVGAIKSAGGEAIGVKCDIAKPDDITVAVKQTADAFGGVDILVNNASAHAANVKPLTEVTAEEVHAQMDLGPIACMRFMQAVYPHMEQKGGRVINLATMLGIMGAGLLAPFAMAKESIRTLTRVAAREWGPKGITVNAICPFAMTDGLMAMGKKFQEAGAGGGGPPMPPLGRIGSPEEDIAPLAVFLASGEAGFLTGYTYMADGGGAIDAAR